MNAPILALRASVAALALIAAATSASRASILVHDTLGEFLPPVYSPVGSVPPARTMIANLFDTDPPHPNTTMLSLGRGAGTANGGTLELTITPNLSAVRHIISGSFRDVTFNGGGDPTATIAHREAAEFWLGNSVANTWTLSGRITNAAGTSSFTDLAAGIVSFTISAFAPHQTEYSFTVNSGLFDRVRFVDVTSPTFGTTSNSTDGFELNGLRIESVLIPEPATTALFASALLGFALARRRAA